MIAQRKITCCKDCDERYVGCHGECERYKKQSEIEQKRIDDIRANYKKEADFRDCRITAAKKTMRMSSSKIMKKKGKT